MAQMIKKGKTGGYPAAAVNNRGKISFPLRVGAVDVGSNAIRLLVAEFSSQSIFKVLQSERMPVRLGHDVFLTGRLTQHAMNASLTALTKYHELIKRWDVAHYRAVTTSAVRESKNGDAFLDRVKRKTGLQLEMIAGSEEARLVYLAAKNRISLGHQDWVIVDLGGGSVEASRVNSEGILWSESHTMGSVRLLEELSDSGTEPGRFRKLLEEYVSILRIPVTAGQHPPIGLIATGGSIEQLARIASALPDSQGISRFSVADLRGVIEHLTRHSYHQRIEKFGLREDQADVILPAAMVYERLAALTGMAEITVPYVGVKEGIVLDIVEDLVTHRAHRERQEEEVVAGAVHLGRRYMFDEAHARQVTKLALSIHDQLLALGRIDGEDRLLLLAAALLHDIGTYISFKKHHRHSGYIILQSELPNLAPRQMLIAAIVARYHRKGEPSPHHEDYSMLNQRERQRVNRLAAILRLADSLDREHQQRVSRVILTEEGDDEIVLRLEGGGDMLLERWAFERKTGMFEKVFGCELALRSDKVNHDKS
jgi:exopolyphosphatase / guanosine-5'-triphosphate,3'-diphosphate pyrophosphatase